MGKRVKVTLNHTGMAELLSSKAIAADGMARGERVASQARSTAVRVTGNYADHIVVSQEKHGDRIVTKIGSTVEYAPVVEARTGSMARALDAGA